MRKILSAVIALVIAMSAVTVYAEQGKTAEFLKTVKERVEIPAELNEFESSVSQDANGTSYGFEWWSDCGRITVFCNNEKVITYYSYYREDDFDGERKPPAFPKTDSETLKAAAQDFVNKLNPGLEIKVTGENNSLYGNTAYFDLQRTENGIDVDGMNGYIEINMHDMSVRGMHIPYVNIEGFDAAAETIAADEAKKDFLEKLGFELVYKGYYKDGKHIFFPAYINDNGNMYISAVTGEVFEHNPYEMYAVREDLAAASDKGSGVNGFTEEEQAELDKISGLLTKTEIERKVRSNKLIAVPNAYELIRISLNRDYYDDTAYMYSMLFSDSQRYISAYADAKSGEIYNINAVENWDEVERADQKTIEKAVSQLTPSLSEKYRFDGKQMSRYENDIRVIGDTADVQTDKNGKIVSYNINYTKNGVFSELDGVISADEAAEKIFELGGYHKKYLVDSDKKAYLVYDFERDVTLHAISGKSVGYDGEELQDGKYTYTDIENHYAREYIEELAKYGIGFSGGEFKPDEYITASEFNKLLSFLFIETSDNSSELLTREGAAVSFVKAIGLDAAARYDDIFVQPFIDVTQNKGYIAILKAMGIFSGDDNGSFNPYNNLTRGEAAVIIYKYLNR